MRLADVSVLGEVSLSLVEGQNLALSRVTVGLEKLSPRPKHPPGPLHVVPGSGLLCLVDQSLTALGLTLSWEQKLRSFTPAFLIFMAEVLT